MIGGIIGDIVGSRFEFDNYRAKDFNLFAKYCSFTDDSVMTLALCRALLNHQQKGLDLGEEAVVQMQKIGRPYPDCGYGGHFRIWMYSDTPHPYNSYGNGAAMRVGGCGYAGDSLEEVKRLSRAVTEVTHNDREGIKGAEATAVSIFLARIGEDKAKIREMIQENYYPLDFTIDGIRDSYMFNESCQGTVPQALEAFLESENFEDAIRIAISVGGDSDTLACITGSVAEAYYGVPGWIRVKAESYLDSRLLSILRDFEAVYPGKVEAE